MSKQFQASLRRHYYVTPTSYLELIGTFKQVLETKRAEAKKASHVKGMRADQQRRKAGVVG